MKAIISLMLTLAITPALADGNLEEPILQPIQTVPLGWVYGPYVYCYPEGCWVSVDADGLNVRATPGGPPVSALVNGTPIRILQHSPPWVLISTPCNLAYTGIWSDTDYVPLVACGD